MTNVQERLPAAIGAIETPQARAQSEIAFGRGVPTAGTADDRVSPLMRPQNTPAQSPQSILQQLLSLITQLISAMGLGTTSPGGAQQTYYQNAQASSTGDPHLAFSGTGESGLTQQSHFDSMSGHADLLDSSSFAGGFRISTATTQPDANGITYNERAGVATNFGRTRVTLEKDGDAYVSRNGRRFDLQPGHSYDLGNGERVTRNADGSLQVAESNGVGGSILTTLSLNGHGVDVHAQAQDVALGGDLPGGGA